MWNAAKCIWFQEAQIILTNIAVTLSNVLSSEDMSEWTENQVIYLNPKLAAT